MKSISPLSPSPPIYFHIAPLLNQNIFFEYCFKGIFEKKLKKIKKIFYAFIARLLCDCKGRFLLKNPSLNAPKKG